MNKWLVPGILGCVCLAAVGFAGWHILHPKPRTLLGDLIAENAVLVRLTTTKETTPDDNEELQRLDQELDLEVAANPQGAIDILTSEGAPTGARQSAAMFLGIDHIATAAPGLLKCTYSPDRGLVNSALFALDDFAVHKRPMPPDLKSQIEKRSEDILWKGPKLTNSAALLISDSLSKGDAVQLFTKVSDQFGFGDARGKSAANLLVHVAGRTHDPKIAAAVDQELARLALKDPKDAKDINDLRQEAKDDRTRATRG